MTGHPGGGDPRASCDLSTWLRRGFEGWRGRPLWAHALAVGLLVAVLALRFAPATASPDPLPDEVNYFKAFRWVARGESPYLEGAYLYPPVLAVLGGRALESFGQGPVLAAIRIANLLGAAVAAWCATAWLPWRWRGRLALAAAVLCLSPAVRFGYLWGNLSLAVAGMVLLGLLAWRRAPLLSGLLLGASIGVKPVAPAAVVVLAAHRPADPRDTDGRPEPEAAASGDAFRRRKWIAGAVAAAVAAALLLAFPHLGEMRAVAGRDLVSSSVSLHRLPSLLGLDLHPLWLWSAATLAAALLARGRPLGPAQLTAWASATTLAATPMVWPHTLVLSLPVQVLALEVAWWRLREGAGGRRRVYELIVVGLAVAGLELSRGATAISDQPRLIQAGALLPALALPALAVYLVLRTDRA